MIKAVGMSRWVMSRFWFTLNTNNNLKVEYLNIGEKVVLKSLLIFLLNPFAISLFLYLTSFTDFQTTTCTSPLFYSRVCPLIPIHSYQLMTTILNWLHSATASSLVHFQFHLEIIFLLELLSWQTNSKSCNSQVYSSTLLHIQYLASEQ